MNSMPTSSPNTGAVRTGVERTRTQPRGLLHFAVAGLLALLVAMLALTTGVTPAHALDRRSGDLIVVDSGTVISDDLFAAGRVVRIDGRVQGDVFAFAQHVTVAGTIDGDLIVAAQEVVLDGQVRGNLRAAGATLVVNGVVDRNVTGAAQLLQLGSGGRIGGNWMGAGDTISLSGDVGGSLAAAGDTVLLQGRVGRGAELGIGSLVLGPQARIGGDLQYHAREPLSIRQDAVAGNVQFLQLPERPQREARPAPTRFFNALSGFLSLAWLAGSAAVGLFMIRTFPRFVARFLEAIEAKPLPSFVTGVVALVATLPVVFLLGITIVGLPAALVLAGGYAGAIFTGWLLLAVAAGSVLVGLVARGRTLSLSWAFLLGLATLYVATRVPFLGPLVWFVAASLGLGALLIAAYATWQRGTTGVATEPVATPDPFTTPPAATA